MCVNHFFESLDALKARLGLFEVEDQHFSAGLSHGFNQGLSRLFAAAKIIGRDM